MGGEGENRFYLVKTKAWGDKSLLQYIVDNGPRMMKQREDLLDVLAKHVETVNSDGKPLDQKQIELKIINNLKLGLPSSTGLAECIQMTEEKFPWSKIKVGGMIALSITINLLSLGLYFVDVFTDGQFVDEMLENSYPKNFTISHANCTEQFYREMEEWRQFCRNNTKNIKDCPGPYDNLTMTGQKCREIGLRF